MFDETEHLIESSRSLSRVAATLISLITVLCCYVLQRSIMVVTALPEVFPSQAGGGRQVSIFGVEFSFATMTTLWPAVLGGLCVAYTFVVAKQLALSNRLSRICPEAASALHLIDAFLMTPRRIGMSKPARLWSFIAIAPLTTVWVHAVAGVLVVVGTLVNPPPFFLARAETVMTPFLLVKAVVFLCSVALGLYGSRGFFRSLHDARFLVDAPLLDSSQAR